MIKIQINKYIPSSFNIQIDQIDFLRGIAILLVFLFNFLIYFFLDYQELEYDSNGLLIISSARNFILNFNPLGQGWVRVELFLIISGFLINYKYLIQYNFFIFHEFFSNRFWRIYPPYILCFIFFYITNGVYTMDVSYDGVKIFIQHILLIHNLRQESFFAINPSYLSILSFTEIILSYEYRKRWVYLFFSLIMKFGVVSYSLYLIHQPFMVYLLDFYSPASNFPVFNLNIQFVSTFITLVLISISLYFLEELKSIELGSYFMNKIVFKF